MPTRLLFGCFCAVALGATGAAEDKPKDDATAVQGTWVTVARSKPAEPDIICEQVVFKGDKLTFHYKFDGKQFTTECTFKLDSTASPKRIDFTPADGGNKGKAYPGIYEFKDGELWFAYRGPDSTRPKNFTDEQEKNNGTVWYAFESAKAKKDK